MWMRKSRTRFGCFAAGTACGIFGRLRSARKPSTGGICTGAAQKPLCQKLYLSAVCAEPRRPWAGVGNFGAKPLLALEAEGKPGGRMRPAGKHASAFASLPRGRGAHENGRRQEARALGGRKDAAAATCLFNATQSTRRTGVAQTAGTTQASAGRRANAGPAEAAGQGNAAERTPEIEFAGGVCG